MKNLFLFTFVIAHIHLGFCEINNQDMKSNIANRIEMTESLKYKIEYVESISTEEIDLDEITQRTNDLLERTGIKKSDNKYQEFFDNQFRVFLKHAKSKVKKRKVINTNKLYISSYHPVDFSIEKNLTFGDDDKYFITEVSDKIKNQSYEIDRQFKYVHEFENSQFFPKKKMERAVFPEHFMFWLKYESKGKSDFFSLFESTPVEENAKMIFGETQLQQFDIINHKTNYSKSFLFENNYPFSLRQYIGKRNDKVLGISNWFGSLKVENANTTIPQTNTYESYNSDGSLREACIIEVYSCSFNITDSIPDNALEYVKNEVNETYSFEIHSDGGKITKMSYSDFFTRN